MNVLIQLHAAYFSLNPSSVAKSHEYIVFYQGNKCAPLCLSEKWRFVAQGGERALLPRQSTGLHNVWFPWIQMIETYASNHRIQCLLCSHHCSSSSSSPKSRSSIYDVLVDIMLIICLSSDSSCTMQCKTYSSLLLDSLNSFVHTAP